MNYLIPLEFDHRDKKNLYWKFQCVCGKIHITRKRDVERGFIKSCGCKRGEILSQREPTWSKPEGIAARNALMISYKGNALKRNIEYSLTIEQFEIITKANCYYCGVEPRQQNANLKRNGTYIYNGIDRIDNTKGYVYNNCVPACGVCNVAKNNLTNEEFEMWLNRLIAFQLNKLSKMKG